MVRNDKVGVSPGSAFSLGDPRDDSYVRICFAQDAPAAGLDAKALRSAHAAKRSPSSRE